MRDKVKGRGMNSGRAPPATPQSPVPPNKGERGSLGPGPLADLSPVEGRKKREREGQPLHHSPGERKKRERERIVQPTVLSAR